VVLIEPRFLPTRSGRYRFPCGGAIGTGTLPGPSAFHRSSTIPRSRAPAPALSASPRAPGACWPARRSNVAFDEPLWTTKKMDGRIGPPSGFRQS